jgi:opacity protein-like surface antigen
MKHLFLCAAVLGSALTASAAAIDLTSWQKRGPSANGTWTVASGGGSVVQSINNNPTFFVSPTNFIDTTIRGSIEVQTTSDDDFIGFVFGFNGPVANGNDMNFVLFDWKQLNQSGSLEGFALSRVNGTITDYDPGFWQHNDSPEFDVLATDYGTTKGWADNTVYNFTILYQTSRIKIDIAGGAFGTGATIFDVAGSFPDGRFGFYNYSQSAVRYAGLTEDATPVNPTVPEPSTTLLMAAGLAALPLLRRYVR